MGTSTATFLHFLGKASSSGASCSGGLIVARELNQRLHVTSDNLKFFEVTQIHLSKSFDLTLDNCFFCGSSNSSKLQAIVKGMNLR